jgi:aminoglycoside phosphotransferase (APT) family kinase protein
MPPRRRLTLDVDLAAAREILRRFDIPSTPVGIGRLHGGSTEVYRIDLAGEAAPLVLKIYPDEPDWRPAKERLVGGWLLDALDVPTPRSLGLDASRALLPLRFALMTTLPGAPVRSWMTGETLDGVYRQMGALLRQMHAIAMPGYGYIRSDGVERPLASNLDYMTQAFASAFRRFRDAGADADLASRLEALAATRMDLAVSTGPVLCHDDLHQGNVLVERRRDGELAVSGLIDFGNARAADPLFDLAKALFCSSHEDPRAGAPLLQGYGDLDHPDPEAALWFYTLHHRVSMWAWLIGLGQSPDAPDGPGGLLRDLREMAADGPRTGKGGPAAPDLIRLEAADRAENRELAAGTAEYAHLRARDADRRRQVREILRRGGERSPAESYAAAWILNHGDTIEELAEAHALATIAAQNGVREARWLAAATLDRGLMYRGLPQRFGTNFVPDGRRYRLWDIDPTTTDADRLAWDVPPLAELERKAEEATATTPQPSLDEAPDWLKGAITRWRATT